MSFGFESDVLIFAQCSGERHFPSCAARSLAIVFFVCVVYPFSLKISPLNALVAAKGAEIRAKYGPAIGWAQLTRMLADRECVRYPCELVFDAGPLEPDECAYPAPNGERPEDGFRLFIHPYFSWTRTASPCSRSTRSSRSTTEPLRHPTTPRPSGRPCLGSRSRLTMRRFAPWRTRSRSDNVDGGDDPKGGCSCEGGD